MENGSDGMNARTLNHDGGRPDGFIGTSEQERDSCAERHWYVSVRSEKDAL